MRRPSHSVCSEGQEICNETVKQEEREEAFKPEVRTDTDVAAMADNLVRHAAYLAALRERTGRTVSLELEPEPCCYIETIEEAVRFSRNHLFSADAVASW